MASPEIEEYLARARQADASAKQAHSLTARRCWRVIAEEYRALAEQSLQRMQAADEDRKQTRQ